jgi:hypothetical protein
VPEVLACKAKRERERERERKKVGKRQKIFV